MNVSAVEDDPLDMSKGSSVRSPDNVVFIETGSKENHSPNADQKGDSLVRHLIRYPINTVSSGVDGTKGGDES